MVGYYDYGLGEWVEDEYDRKKKAKRKGLEEVGSVEEAYRCVKKPKELGEDDFKAMIVDSMNRYKYDKFAQWKVKRQQQIADYKQHEQAYLNGAYTFNSISR